jgi:hypothetical protein
MGGEMPAKQLEILAGSVSKVIIARSVSEGWATLPRLRFGLQKGEGTPWILSLTTTSEQSQNHA